MTVSAGRFARLGFTDADAAARGWAGVGCDDEGLLEVLGRVADPDLALTTLHRLVEAAEAVGDADRLRAALCDGSETARRLCLVLGASTSLGDHLVVHPQDWSELTDASLDCVRPTAASLIAALRQASDPDDLRRIYRRLLLRLAARDLSLDLPVEDAAAELSDLAAGSIAAALTLARTQVGAPAQRCRITVIGMGKAGAHELNYSSDVDVLFVAEPEDGAEEHEAMRAATAVAGATMRICSAHTTEGTLWPVDAALRPEGNAGSLVRSLSSYETYYHRWAKTWEFQALLKARPIAGDEGLGERFMETVLPLVWTAADRPNFVADVQAMRRRVVENLDAEGAERQLKLGPGGLRDIEFAVQLLQLVHGRSDPQLRSPNTLQALGALTTGGYVGRDDGSVLADAYRYLRTLEHRLQLSHLRRTHTLPDDPDALRVLGRSLGYFTKPATRVTAEWRRNVVDVRRLHQKLFYRPLLDAVAAVPTGEVRLTTDAAKQRLEALGYLDPVAALRHLQALTTGVSRRAAIQRALLPAMLSWFAEAPDPDMGLLGFRRLSDTLGSTHWYLRMLRDEGASAERLAHLLATSRYATDLLMRAPEATVMLGDSTELAPRDAGALVAEARAAALRQDDPEAAAHAVRAVRRRELFRVAAADIFGMLEVEEVGQALTAVARATLEGGLAAATAAVEAERAKPIPTRLAMIALGRSGGHEMSYGSDADVMFVHDPEAGADEEEAAVAAFAVVNELRRLLALPGPDPALALDVDLRPEGRQGPLVRTLSSYAAYYAKWSRVWEAQALLRAEPIGGDPELGERFIAMIDPLRYPERGLTDADVGEVRRIKARVDGERLPRGADPATHLKLGRGGLADVEWTIQLLQMRYAHATPSLQTTRTAGALGAAVSAGYLGGDDADELLRAWRFASKIRNAFMLVRGRPSDTLPTGPRDRVGVAYLCGYPADEVGRLTDDYLRVSRRASAAVERVFWS